MCQMKRFLIPLAAAGILVFSGCGMDSYMTESADEGGRTETCDLPDDFSILNIEAGWAEVTICPGEKATMEVCLDKGYEVEQEVKGDTLYLTEKYNAPFWKKYIHFGQENNEITITLPENKLKELVISSDNKDVMVSDQQIDKISIWEGNAGVQISDCESENLMIENDNGDVEIQNVSASLTATLGNGRISIADCGGETLDVENDNGDIFVSGVEYTSILSGSSNGKITFENTKTASITVDDDNGSVELELFGKQNEFNYDIYNNNGSVVIGDSSFGDLDTELKLSNDVDQYVTASLGNGNLTVKFFK